jgi:photosystem II stability/assembly factor-like uncharacterized protein
MRILCCKSIIKISIQKMKKLSRILIAVLLMVSSLITAQEKKDENIYNGLSFRHIGPSYSSGRISDIAIHPSDENIWYVATGSAGVWKTVNAGITWKPVFENQTSYSIGCVTIDPSNPHTVWVGTGENTGGRHVGFGDGVYVSHDDGETWTNTGLKQSGHIAKIIIHPKNSAVVWVAAQGPLWNKGGERGIYKSTDGGKTWRRTLYVNEWTGATDLAIDPENPNVLYAATWQRHRTVASFIGGGPGSGIYKSTDGGETWVKLSKGLPQSRLGKTGLAISPFHHDMIFAAIETDRRTGGFYISRNGGMSWQKQSDIVGKGTGPHYYQEIFASPHRDGLVYFFSNWSRYTVDFGKTFKPVNEKNKHVDTHAIAFIPSDPDFVLFGTDGGLYESRDGTRTWRHIDNLPLTQFYRICVDDTQPFYNIYGGTQDNGTQGGPSRTTSSEGIIDGDWHTVLFADGYQTAVEPGNPDIVYGEFQEGALWRVDMRTGEAVFIQPQASQGEAYERYNWNAPILISPHRPERIYIGSQRLWKSENRGDDWEPISPDLTRNQERFEIPVMGKVQSWDNCWDYVAMSSYNTITAITESPVQEGLLYVGTDDGRIQITENGGKSWQKVEIASIKGIPGTCYVNFLLADLYDASTVYACLDNHKTGDFQPYILKSTDKGRTWKSIRGNLPGRLIVWRMVQDHKDRNLLFIATEFGVYFTRDGGTKWHPLKGKLPVIPFRDITIQRQHDDLVCGSFARGIYILDDIAPLREYDPAHSGEARLFPVRETPLYVPTQARYALGDARFAGENPPFGALISYYLPEKQKSLKEIRVEKEKPLEKEQKDIPFPGWEALERETNQEPPAVWLVIKDSQGNTVNAVPGTANKGFNRINWELDYADRSGEALRNRKKINTNQPTRLWVEPGEYSVSLMLWKDGEYRQMGSPKTFTVKRLHESGLPTTPPEEIRRFRKAYTAAKEKYRLLTTRLKKDMQKVEAMKRAFFKMQRENPQLSKRLYDVRETLLGIERKVYDYKTKDEMEEHPAPSPGTALNVLYFALRTSTSGPTPYHRKVLDDARRVLDRIYSDWKKIHNETLPALERDLKEAGAPVIIE